MKESKLLKVMIVMFKVLFVIGVIGVILIPWLFDLFFSGLTFRYALQPTLYKAIIYLYSIGILFIIYQLIKIFITAHKETPFKESVTNNVRNISYGFIYLSIIMFVKLFFSISVISIVLLTVTTFVGLCFFVLAKIYKLAVEYKEESDYTV